MSPAPRFAVVLSGCGVFDGSEIHESVLTLLAIGRHGGQVQCFAPDIPQRHTINHLTGETAGDARNVLVESARIARGEINPLSDLDLAGIDILIFPGGFGAAKNLCTYAVDGPACQVDPQVDRIIRAAAKAGIPIGAWCIAPVVIARVLGAVTLTIGTDPKVAQDLAVLGATHQVARADQTVVDSHRKVVSTPCYMAPAPLTDIADGIHKAVGDLIHLARAV